MQSAKCNARTNARCIVVPHAGLIYSGKTAAHAFKAIDTKDIERVVIFGPSHHSDLITCAVTACDSYETPLGELKVDTAARDALIKACPQVKLMTLEVDEDEHSIELELPFIKEVFSEKVKILPIMVG